jgi:hypothetical protein
LVWHDLTAAIARLPPEVKQYRSRRQLLTGGLLSCGAFDCAQILKNADLALHRAKSDGHGNYRFFETAMDEKMQCRRNLEIDLRRALTLGEFALVYQPQLDLSSNRITGFEALLRWHCPTRGHRLPARIHPGRGRNRYHCPDWRMGALDRMPGGGKVAWRAYGCGQCFGDPVREPQSGPGDPVGAGGKRPRSAAPGA